MGISLFSVFLTNISCLDETRQRKLFLNYIVVINNVSQCCAATTSTVSYTYIALFRYSSILPQCFRLKCYVFFSFFCFQVDFEQLQENLCQMERRCKASWDHLKAIAKHEMKPTLKQKMSEFLKDCAERIIILKIVHRRIINRYRIRLVTPISC